MINWNEVENIYLTIEENLSSKHREELDIMLTRNAFGYNIENDLNECFNICERMYQAVGILNSLYSDGINIDISLADFFGIKFGERSIKEIPVDKFIDAIKMLIFNNYINNLEEDSFMETRDLLESINRVFNKNDINKLNSYIEKVQKHYEEDEKRIRNEIFNLLKNNSNLLFDICSVNDDIMKEFIEAKHEYRLMQECRYKKMENVIRENISVK